MHSSLLIIFGYPLPCNQCSYSIQLTCTANYWKHQVCLYILVDNKKKRHWKNWIETRYVQLNIIKCYVTSALDRALLNSRNKTSDISCGCIISLDTHTPLPSHRNPEQSSIYYLSWLLWPASLCHRYVFKVRCRFGLWTAWEVRYSYIIKLQSYSVSVNVLQPITLLCRINRIQYLCQQQKRVPPSCKASLSYTYLLLKQLLNSNSIA
jgi:hypothetical protein